MTKADETRLVTFLQNQDTPLSFENSQELLDSVMAYAQENGIPGRPGKFAAIVNRAVTSQKSGKTIQRVQAARPKQYICPSAAQVNLDDVQTPEFFIPQILSVGVTFCNSPPKGGKSRLFLQMALALARGGTFMGRRCRHAGVLYLALEDERMDFESRLQLFLKGEQAPENLFFATSEDFNYCPPTLEENALLDVIEQNLRVRPEIRVVLIDVFGVIRSKRQRNEDFTDHERRDIQTLIRLASSNNIAVVVAHHVSHTKRRGTLETIGSGAGSFVVAATIHAEWLLIKSGDNGATTFSVQGRRIPLQKFAVEDDFPQWRYCGGVDEYEAANSPLIITVKHIVDNCGDWCGSGSEIIQYGQENGLPAITEKINKNTFSPQIIKQLSIIGVRYLRISNGSGGVKHRFVVDNR